MSEKSGPGLSLRRLFRRKQKDGPEMVMASNPPTPDLPAHAPPAPERAGARPDPSPPPGWADILPQFRPHAAWLGPAEFADHRARLLIEAEDFFFRDDAPSLGAQLATAGCPADIAFVPPRFIRRAADGAADAPATLARWRQAAAARQTTLTTAETGIRILCLADHRLTRRLTEALAAPLEAELGAKVVIEAACLPPAPILLSDLIFRDWFAPDATAPAFAAIDAALARLREASLILADDALPWLGASRAVTPVLSHAMVRHHAADRLVLRAQAYTRHHDALPISLAAGRTLPPASHGAAMRLLGQYLDVPVFRVLSDPSLAPLSPECDCVLAGSGQPARADAVRDALLAFVRARPLRRVALPAAPHVAAAEPARFGAVLAAQPMLDALAGAFSHFVLAGPDASLPYLRQQLRALGKTWLSVERLDAPEVADAAAQGACLVACGAWGEVAQTMPTVALMPIGQGGLARGLGNAAASLGAPASWLESTPDADDWYCPVPRRAWTDQEQTTLAEAQRAARPGRRRLA